MWRTVIVASGEKLNIKDNWLIVSSAEGESRVPVSDIYSLVIENRAAMLSVSVLTTLTQAGAHIILCDEKHLPVSATLPINTHYRPFNVIKKQIDMTYEFKNLLWQKIIERKIHNQYLCLKYREINKEKCDEIDALSKSVKPGDTTNREAVAARKYFVALFGSTFRRTDEDVTNASLNYGYAIIRSCVAKTLAGYGFNGTVGIHHINETNPFNLADDIMEPLRPVVDMWTDENCDTLFETLTYSNRKNLIDLPNQIILQSDKRMRIRYAIEIYVKSLVSAIENNNVSLLEIPELIPFDIFFEDEDD